MRVLRKRHSWPPTRKFRYTYPNDTIDSDPFAYFVSPAEDRQVYYIEGSLTAGIHTKPRARSLPPFHSRKPRLRLSISLNSKSPTARLKRWIERMEKQYFHCSYQDADTPDPIIKVIEPRQNPSMPTREPVIIPISPPVRGRRDARSGSGQRRTRRPRVWREPSSEIWTVAEEDEEANSGLGIRV